MRLSHATAILPDFDALINLLGSIVVCAVVSPYRRLHVHMPVRVGGVKGKVSERCEQVVVCV